MLSFFKKDKYDFIKITVSILFSAIMVMLCSRVILTSYALPNTAPNTLTSGQNDPIADRVNLFPSLDGEEIIALNSFYATDSSGVKYIVYCLEKEKLWSPNQTLTKNSTPLDSGYAYIVQNGYPAKSLTGNDENDEYLTRIAVWWYQDRSAGVSDTSSGVLTANQKSVIKASSYYQYIEPLVTGAVNAKNNPTVINPSFSLNSSSFKLSSDHTYLITDLINISSNVSFDSYRVSVNNSAVQILDENNSPVTGNINSGKGFKLRVNLSSIDNPITVNVSVVVNYSEYEAYSYSPPSNLADNMQQSFAAALVPVAKQKTISSSVSMPTGSLTINKLDSSNDSPLAGAEIEVKRMINDKVIDTFTTTTTAHTISNLLPGVYQITELSAPTGYYIDNSKTEVIIDTSNLNVNKNITNSKFGVKIRKVDSDTKNPVSGAVLNIVNSSNVVVSTITTEDDYISLSNLVEGEYKVVEVKAPDGYLVSDKTIEFTVNKDNPMVTVDFEDKKNEVIIEKKDSSNNNFISGATLRLVKVSDNSTIDEWTTSSKGYSIKGLSKGSYKVIEVKAPDGYTLSSSEVTFEITGDESESKTVTFYNTKNQITIDKVDSDTGESLKGAKLRVTNSTNDEIVTFTTDGKPHELEKLEPGTYYVEELEAPSGYIPSSEKTSFTVDSTTSNLQIKIKNTKNQLLLAKVDGNTGNYLSGATLVLKDSEGEEVEKFTTTNEPKIIYGLAYGKYTLEEVNAPVGYVKTDEIVEINYTEDSDFAHVYSISNYSSSLVIQKVDSETNEPLSGAKISITGKDNDYSRVITTTLEPTIISGLEAGTYEVKEEVAPDGYILDDTVHTIEITSENYNYNIKFENKPITLKLGKTDANTGEYIAGATLQLNREDGIMEPITFVSTTDPYIVNRVSPGIYTLTELQAPSGYVGTSSKVTFEVLNTGKVQNVSISSDIISISIKDRKLIVNANGNSGYKFNLSNSVGVTIDEFTTTEGEYSSPSLELGDYVLRQIEAPDGVIVNDTPLYFTVTDSDEVSVVKFINDFTKINISKKDIANSEEISGANLVIRNSSGDIVEEWISTDKPHYIEKLPVGNYSLTETIAPDGYVLNTSVVEFEVLETGDIQTATMFNSKPVEVPNTYRNANYVYIIGGILVVAGASIMIISKRKKLFAKSR